MGAPSARVLWLLDQNGRVSMRPVVPGPTDGKMIEISPGRGIEEGATVIVGFNGQSTTTSTSGSDRHGPPGMRIF
jgi:hypothetical protein